MRCSDKDVGEQRAAAARLSALGGYDVKPLIDYKDVKLPMAKRTREAFEEMGEADGS